MTLISVPEIQQLLHSSMLQLPIHKTFSPSTLSCRISAASLSEIVENPLSVQKETVNPDLIEILINSWWLLVRRQETWKFYTERFEFKTVNDVEVRGKVAG